jgi:hypothetical protein
MREQDLMSPELTPRFEGEELHPEDEIYLRLGRKDLKPYQEVHAARLGRLANHPAEDPRHRPEAVPKSPEVAQIGAVSIRLAQLREGGRRGHLNPQLFPPKHRRANAHQDEFDQAA